MCEGAFGTVYEGKIRSSVTVLPQDIAIKTINKSEYVVTLV